MKRHEISEKQWNRIKDKFPPEKKPQGGRPGKSNLEMLNAILYWLNTGIPWRDLPERFGPWQSVYSRFRARTKAGIWEDILTALIAQDLVEEAQVWRALEEAQLADFVRGLPEGLDTVIGERGIRLSGGQRQRIGIARALYPNPELLFFDEATSALDTETEAAIMESINRLHGKKTLVIIAHRLATIADCDMVYRVGEGKIVQER